MTFKHYVDFLVSLLNNEVVPIILGLSFVTFLWGMFHYYILKGSDANERGKARTFMMWGLIGMVLLFTVWGLVNIAKSALMI